MDICVTGASRGLGLALTTEFLRRGHRVWAVARTTETLDQLAPAYPDQLFLSTVDITEESTMKKWSAAMNERDFSPDYAILNASVLLKDCTSDGIDTANMEKTITINLVGTLRTVSALLPSMLQKKKGSLVFVSSTSSMRPVKRSASYSASKAGIRMAVRSLRQAYAGSGVRFADIVLGPIATEMWEGRRSFLVPTVEKAGASIATFALSEKQTLFYPKISTTLLRLVCWLPDRLFAFLSTKLLK